MAVLHVIVNGWYRRGGMQPPGADEVSRWLEAGGFVCRGGRVYGIRLRGISEEGIKELIGPMLFDLVQSPEALERNEEQQATPTLQGDSVLAFAASRCHSNTGMFTRLQELYEAYKAFCGARRRRAVRQERFAKSLTCPRLGFRVDGDVVLGISLLSAVFHK